MMDLALGHYPRPRSIVDFKLDALDGRSLLSSWFETKQMAATERDLPIATNRHSLTVQPRWFRCDEATIQLYLPERVESCRNKRCRRWWYCWRMVGNNKNNEDSSLPHREANSNSIWSWYSRHAREFFGARKSWSCDEWEFMVNSQVWTDQTTNIVFYERPISHFHIQ